MADSKTKKKCSFCGRSENEVGFLITGMNGYICDWAKADKGPELPNST